MTPETGAVRVRVRGRVQGVFFRDSTRRRAESLGVAGWVCNLADGRVEVHAEGDAAAVEALIAWCRSGPSRAVVTDVVVDRVAAEGCRGFEIRH
jgi:acylphosphatase